MANLSSMPASGVAVIIVIAILFILAVITLFYVYTRYRALAAKTGMKSAENSSFIRHTADKFREAYANFGSETNTPAIVSDSIATKLGGLLLGERFLNNAVSLFVTLGLFGTFLGLSLSVSSLTELLSYSSTEEWLSILNNVGSGLLSALSGMGVAFYTSLVGVACSIILTILRAIFSPEKQRAQLETRLELYLDHTLAPTLECEKEATDASLVQKLIDSLNETTDNMEQILTQAAADMQSVLDQAAGNMSAALNKTTGDMTVTLAKAAASMSNTISATDKMVGSFKESVGTFVDGVHDFGEVDYSLRGTVERMDLAVRDLSSAMRETQRSTTGGNDK